MIWFRSLHSCQQSFQHSLSVVISHLAYLLGHLGLKESHKFFKDTMDLRMVLICDVFSDKQLVKGILPLDHHD